MLETGNRWLLWRKRIILLALWLLCDHDTYRLVKYDVDDELHQLQNQQTMQVQSKRRVSGAYHDEREIFYFVEQPFQAPKSIKGNKYLIRFFQTRQHSKRIGFVLIAGG